MRETDIILAEWKSENIPIEELSDCVFDKDYTIVSNLDAPECKITITLNDNCTLSDGNLIVKAYMGVLIVNNHNGNPESTVKEIQLWLKNVTNKFVESRRAELERLRKEGHIIEFAHLP